MPEMPQSEIDALGGFRLIAGKFGGSPQGILNKIEELETDNRKYRQETIPALEAKLPKEGFVIVPKKDAEEIEQYRALGKPAEVKTKLETGEKASKDFAEIQTRDLASKFAKAAGLAEDTVDTLTSIPSLVGAKFEVRKGKVKDKTGKEVDGEVAYLTLPGENQTAMKFEDAKEKVPALKGLRTAEVPVPGRNGREILPQGSGGSDKGTTVFDRIREQAAASGKKDDNAPAVIPVERRMGMTRT